MSQICYGLKIDSKEEGDKICEAINSEKFKEILKYTKWSTFQTDWRMFKHFKKDFWKEFISEEEPEDKVKSKKTPIKIDEKIELLPSTELGKIYNPLTRRYIKDTPTNQKKIAQFSLKITAGKEDKFKKSRNKKTRNKKTRNKKSKIRSKNSRIKKTRRFKHKKYY